LPVAAIWLVFARDAYFRPDHLRGIAALVWLILVSNVLAYFCWFRIIRAFPASVASLTTLVVPCIGFASSALLVGGDVTWLDVVALGLIVAAVTLVLTGSDGGRSNQPAKLRQ
jgi:drug/metabolite transporter (DMT)-like permease